MIDCSNIQSQMRFTVLMLLFFIVHLATFANPAREKVVLKRNKNIVSQIVKPNCTYEICDGLDLKGDTIQIPINAELVFKGGFFKNGIICGNNTIISSECKTIFRSIRLQGKWLNDSFCPEWFGAVGDGITDDTESIRKAMFAAAGKKLIFHRKTYIINVTPGKDVNTQRVIFPDCKCMAIYGDSSIIKLGNNDNCNLYKNKGFGAIFSIYTIDSCHVKGIVFDYNYDKNPIFQTQGIRQDVQENTQLNAFQFRRVSKVTIEDCTFIGHSGTNCIDYNDARYDVGDKVFEVTIQRCYFLKSGGKSYYRSGNTYVDAFHDCSTIALHYCGSNHNTPFVVNIKNNFFEGIGGNAYNAIETDASELYFCDNVIKNYVCCIAPCSEIYDGIFTIKNNHFLEVSRGILLWLRGGCEFDTHRYGYRSMNIIGNECVINIGSWIDRKHYDNIGSKQSDRYGFIFTTSGNNKSVKNLSVLANTICYVNIDGVSPKLCSKATINLESVGHSVKMMKCDKMVLSGNHFYNATYRILHNSMFQEIDTLVFNGNYIYEPFKVKGPTKNDGGGVVYLNHSRAYAPSLDYPIVRNFEASNNDVIFNGYKNDDGCAIIMACQMRGSNDPSDNTLVVKGNTCTSTPQYGVIHFSAINRLFNNVEIDELIIKR